MAFGPTPIVPLPPGSHIVTLTVDDGNGGSASDTVLLSVLDAMAPDIAAIAATPDTLQQANHRMDPVTVTLSVSDGSASTCKIVSLVSNEPVDALGDGDTAPDWMVTGDLTVDIRAERAAQGRGRAYRVTVVCTDSWGNSASKTVTMFVPRKKQLVPEGRR